MGTFELTARFRRDFDKLTSEEKHHFKIAVKKFNADLERGRFRKGLRVKSVEGAPGIWEMTWGDDGRATFQYGESKMSGKKHVTWRRIGSHRIFGKP